RGVAKKILELLGRRVCRGAASPVELHDFAFARNRFADPRNFLFQNVKIGKCDSLVFLNDDVARAKQAQTFAEGKMHVERNGSARRVRRGVNRSEIRGTER